MPVTILGRMGTPSDPHIPYTPSSKDIAFYDARYSATGGLTAFIYTQVGSNTVWTINHNLGYMPQVDTYTTGGVQMEGDVHHITDNQVTVTFTTAQSGFARCI